MGKDPSELREEIDETRGRMDETVDALAYKTDLRARIREMTLERARVLRERTNDLRVRLVQMSPSLNDVPDSAPEPLRIVRENPLAVFFGMAAIGFLLGSLLPVNGGAKGATSEEATIGTIRGETGGIAQSSESISTQILGQT